MTPTGPTPAARHSTHTLDGPICIGCMRDLAQAEADLATATAILKEAVSEWGNLVDVPLSVSKARAFLAAHHERSESDAVPAPQGEEQS